MANNVLIKILPRVCLDHSPMIIALGQEFKPYGPSTLKFLRMWCQHKDFNSSERQLETSYEQQGSIVAQYLTVLAQVSSWNVGILFQWIFLRLQMSSLRGLVYPLLLFFFHCYNP